MKLKEYLDTGKTYIIAEMSANHGGSLEKALEIVKYAKLAGADCLKIQTYTADSITINCHNEYFTVKGGLWADKNLYDLYKEAYTPWEWQGRIKEECAKFDLDFLSTPFDNTAVDFLESIGVEAYKIASPELIDIPLIKYVAKKNKPILISCGMGNEEEIREALEVIKENSNETFVLLKCCSEYPTDYTNMNLRTISDMGKNLIVEWDCQTIQWVRLVQLLGLLREQQLWRNIFVFHVRIRQQIVNFLWNMKNLNRWLKISVIQRKFLERYHMSQVREKLED